MSAAKVIKLRVRPLQAAMLSLESDGIVGELTAILGGQVTAFDFAGFYANLGATVAGSPAQLQFDAAGIHGAAAVTASNLLALRAEPVKAALDAAIAARANAYYAKYMNQDAIIALTQQYYEPTVQGSKPQLLDGLRGAAQDQCDTLEAAYTNDSRTGVVKAMTSSLTGGTTTTSGGSTTTTTLGEHASLSTTNTGKTVTTGTDTDTDFGTGTGRGTNISTSSDLSGTGSTGTDEVTGTDTATTTVNETVTENQTIVNTGYDYRIPYIETFARNYRAQISLMDEQFTQFMAGQNIPYLQQVFGNELAVIDLGVKRLQVAYLNTILMSPIAGVVTGIFTNLGNRVRAGSTVIRVENNQTILIEGTVVHREIVSVGDPLTVGTTQFGDPTQPVRITGPIVAACGDESEDDRWHITASCDNIDATTGLPIFPLHYGFDYDDTNADISKITIT